MEFSDLRRALETESQTEISLDDSTSSQAEKNFDENAQHPVSTLWLGRPPIEQGPLLPSSANPQPVSSVDELSSRVNFVWADRILFVKTIRPAFCDKAAAWTLVQDAKGLMMILSIWNYLPIQSSGKLRFDSIADEIPAGTYMAIRQPLLVTNSVWGQNAGVMLRVDNPTCLQMFESQHDFESARAGGADSAPAINIDELKLEADKAFEKKAYRSASRKYHRILQALDDEKNADQLVELKEHCATNLADSYLQLGRYEEAEKCARIMENNSNTWVQEILARSLFHMGRFDQAKDLLLALRSNVKDPTRAKGIQSLLGDCLQAIMEERMGNYNTRKMLVESSLYTELPLHANYRSPKISLGVEITRPSDGVQYRGVLAEDDIKEGTLLTSTRAFAFCFAPRITSSSKAVTQKKELYEVRMVHQAVQHLLNRPSLAPSFYRLEAAGEIHDDKNIPLEPVIDLPKIRGILESNRFGVDVKYPSSPMELKPPSEEAEGDPIGAGLWLDTSMFNHSCTPNAAWTPVGNQMMVYASKDIAKGSEICISYVHVASSYQERKERFSKWSGGKGFECGCEWCHMLRANDELRSMNEEVKKAHQRLTTGDEHFDSINEVLSKSRRKKITKAHADISKRFCHTMYSVHMMEALQHANDGYRESARNSVEAAVELGYEIRGGLRQETRTQDLCCLAAVYMTCNQDDKAKTVLETLCENQLLLPNKFDDFQTFVMMSSMTFWGQYQHEDFMRRWALLNQQVWEARTKALK